MKITEQEALRAYARMLNTGDLSHLEPLLPSDFHYGSQMVSGDLSSKAAFCEYMSAKLLTIAGSDLPVYAEMGQVWAYGAERPCVVLAQGTPENRIGMALVYVNDGVLRRIDLCVVPAPQSARGTGEYPGTNEGGL